MVLVAEPAVAARHVPQAERVLGAAQDRLGITDVIKSLVKA